MAIKLKPETVRRIEQRLKDGRYASADDVVDAGLQLLEQRDSDERLKGAAAGIAEGLEQAHRGELLDGDEALVARRRRRAERQQAG
jgi:putative addiction module CopG family antidote